MRTALICGISGQDGAYLTQLLLREGYRVVGASRDAQQSSFANLKALGVHYSTELVSMSLKDFRSVLQVLKRVEPDEIYNLAGQSSVGLSYEQPVETMESISVATINLLEAIRFLDRPVRYYSACSSECFGSLGRFPADETTLFRPASPYAVAKAAAFWEVSTYREAYGLFACSGILFNHESPLRPSRYVTMKIIESARRIAIGKQDKLVLGDITVSRDWGWAPEYVEAMWLMLQQDEPDDYVIATGEAHTVLEFAQLALSYAGIEIEWTGEGSALAGIDRKSGREVVEISSEFFRPSDLRHSVGNPAKARQRLGWSAKTKFAGVVAGMFESSSLSRIETLPESAVRGQEPFGLQPASG